MEPPQAPLPSLAGLSLEQLQELERRVQARLNELREAARTPAERFRPGDRVGFFVEGHCIEGVVTESGLEALKVQTLHSHFTIPPGSATHLAPEAPR